MDEKEEYFSKIQNFFAANGLPCVRKWRNGREEIYCQYPGEKLVLVGYWQERLSEEEWNEAMAVAR